MKSENYNVAVRMSNAKKRIYIECKQIGDIERYALEYSCVTVRPNYLSKLLFDLIEFGFIIMGNYLNKFQNIDRFLNKYCL